MGSDLPAQHAITSIAVCDCVLWQLTFMLQLHCCQQMQYMKLLLNQLAMSQAVWARSALLTSGTPARVGPSVRTILCCRECAKSFKGKQIEKGVAFPTCVSPNR